MELRDVIGSSMDEPIVNRLNVKLPDNMNWSPLPNIALTTIKKTTGEAHRHTKLQC